MQPPHCVSKAKLRIRYTPTIADMTYIFYEAFSYTRYILGELRDREDIICVEVPFNKGWRKMLHKWSKHLPYSLYTPVAHNKEVKDAINFIKTEDTVILFDLCNYVNVKYLLKHLKCSTVHIWFWNTIGGKMPRILTIDTDKKLLFHTFDPQDAIKYDMLLHNQLYRESAQKESTTEEIYDFFFVGMNKGRFDTLRDLNYRLTKWGFSTKFIIVDPHAESGVRDGIEFRNKDVEYEETLHLIRMSKVLVDCTKSKQTGITLRVLEGLFLNKKVLSNNTEIKNLPFYDSSRHLIFNDMDSEDSIRYFLDVPLTEATAEEKAPYNIKHWLKEITKKYES